MSLHNRWRHVSVLSRVMCLISMEILPWISVIIPLALHHTALHACSAVSVATLTAACYKELVHLYILENVCVLTLVVTQVKLFKLYFQAEEPWFTVLEKNQSFI